MLAEIIFGKLGKMKAATVARDARPYRLRTNLGPVGARVPRARNGRGRPLSQCATARATHYRLRHLLFGDLLEAD